MLSYLVLKVVPILIFLFILDHSCSTVKSEQWFFVSRTKREAASPFLTSKTADKMQQQSNLAQRMPPNTAQNMSSSFSLSTKHLPDISNLSLSENASLPVNTSTQHKDYVTGSSSTDSDVNVQPTEKEKELHISMTLFFILTVSGMCILVVHVLIITRLHYLPESIAIVFVGAAIGLCLRLVGNWRKEEAFPPTIFFLVLLPPIIFESGYNLHKGNFFHNIGSILVFAIFGTGISAMVIGGGMYLLGAAKLIYPFTIVESFAFGSLISAVDPVATLAIFQAMDVDPILYMMVFGESILNDAVSIVLMTSIIGLQPQQGSIGPEQSSLQLFGLGIANFCATFFASAAVGILFALGSALLLKWVDLRRTPSLEVGMMLIFSYAPYCLAEGINLSGIMAILFAGIVNSHYTHLNLSPVTQITIQQTFRAIAFMAETCVFAYLGLAIFSFQHRVELALVIWVLILCLIGRACNIFPLSWLVNHFRQHKITSKNQLVMWFSGLRGAIAFALSLHLEVAREKREILVTTTLIVVLCTILFLGGGTMPMLQLLQCFFLPDGSRCYTACCPGKGSRNPGDSSALEQNDEDDLSRMRLADEEEWNRRRRKRLKSLKRQRLLQKARLLQQQQVASASCINNRVPTETGGGYDPEDEDALLQESGDDEKDVESSSSGRRRRGNFVPRHGGLFPGLVLVRERDVNMSKTKEIGDTVDSEAALSSSAPITDDEFVTVNGRRDRKRRHQRLSEQDFRLISQRSESESVKGHVSSTMSMEMLESELPNRTSTSPPLSMTTGRGSSCNGVAVASGIPSSAGSDVPSSRRQLRGFLWLDQEYLLPFFTRQFTQREREEGRRLMSFLTDKWYMEVRRSAPSPVPAKEEDEGTDGVPPIEDEEVQPVRIVCDSPAMVSRPVVTSPPGHAVSIPQG